MTLLASFEHADGRRIFIYRTYKVRYDRYGYPTAEWSTLYRSDVPNLTDAEWLSLPVESGWRKRDV